MICTENTVSYYEESIAKQLHETEIQQLREQLENQEQIVHSLQQQLMYQIGKKNDQAKYDINCNKTEGIDL